ncbi:MAG: TIGR00180 family glycosyltransferase [Candidatus Methanomethylophilaceae archaeon]
MDCVQELYADEDLSLLKKLTLIIPTHNRNFYLSRCLWYHGHFPFAEIIVADSSVEDKRVVNRETVQKIRDMFGAHITYLEYDYPAEKYGGEIYQKWGDAMQHVVTKYSQSCTDKEFLIPTTISKCIKFLDEHPDYSIAEGMDYQIRHNEDNEIAFYPWQGDKSYSSDKPLDRIYASLTANRPVGTQFSVQRTDNHKKIFDDMGKYNLYDIRYGEALIELAPLIFGKTQKFSSNAGNIRDTCSFKSGGVISKINLAESSCRRYPLIPDYPEERYESLYAHLHSYLSDKLCVNQAEIDHSENVNKVINQFLSKRYQYKQSILNKHKKLQRTVQRTWDALPLKLQEKIRTLLGEDIIVQSSNPETKITPEMKCINDIILSKKEYYESDMPII